MTADRTAASGVGASLDELWALLPGSDRPPPASRIVPVTHPVASGYRVADVAGAAVAAATAAAVEVGRGRGLPETDPITIETDHAMADWRGYVEVDGSPPPMWAELSGRYLARDGRFVQLHCNFPHHAEGVVRRLGVEHDRSQVADAIAQWDAFELEDALRNDGMICAAYRTPAEWSHHPHAAATDELGLIEVDQIGEAGDRPLAPATARDRPLDGVRVLDCSRVLAGPVCGRTLAAHGADVLRVGASHLPSIPGAVIATGFGKRNADVDLTTAAGQARFRGLLADADVFVDAFRPGALAALGFSAERAAELEPGIVVVEISAFDWVGPWAGRRGFDSIIQSTTGIALGQAEVVGSEVPVHLPVQALDFATGYLAAFAAARLVAHRADVGGSWRARLSLLRTRNWLAGLGGPVPFERAPAPDIDRYLHTVDSPFGRLRAVRPIAGRWDRPPDLLGSSDPVWL